MIFTLELLLEIFLIYKIFTEKDRTNLFMWFMTASIMLMPGFKLGLGIPPCNWMFPIVGLLRVLIIDKNIIQSWKSFPLKYLYAALLIFHFVQPLFVKYESWNLTYFHVFQYTMRTYLYLFIGYCFAPSYKDLMEKRTWILIWIISLFVIAVISSFITFNFISSTLNEASIWTGERYGTDRGFRVTGTVGSPNIFGFINVLLSLFVFKLDIKLIWKYVLVSMLLMNLVLCGTRAPLLGLFAVLGVSFIFISKIKIIKLGITSFLIISLLVNIFGTNEIVKNYIKNSTDLILTGGENTKGSTTDLREIQLNSAMNYAEDKPIWGNGNEYTYNLMNNRHTSDYDSDLHGAEGYLFFLLIDYGFVYIGIVVAFFVYIIFIFIKSINTNKDVVMLGLPSTIALLVHLASSRPDNSWQIFMPLIGACLAMIIRDVKQVEN